MRTIAAAAFLLLSPVLVAAAPPLIGELHGEDCSHVDEHSQDEVVGYWLRHPPLVGYRRGERLLAGGDGSCVLGFPKSDDQHALVLVDGARIPVYRSDHRGDSLTFASRDGAVKVELAVTGVESTCEPDSEKCCGDYTYVTLTVSKGGRKNLVRAVTYAGG